MKHLITLCLIALTMVSSQGRAVADFVFSEEIALGSEVFTPYGIAFDGTNWHISDSSLFASQFGTYDTDFNLISTTSVAAGIQNFRGLTFDPNSWNLFGSEHSGGEVYEFSLDGTIIQQFDTNFDFGLTGLAYNRLDDSLWLSRFGGTIQNRTRTGEIISSFSTGAINDWTGIAYDEINDSLLLLSADDTLFEYRTDGTLVAQLLDSDLIQGNGLGLAYDSSIGRLFVTSQLESTVTIFDDPSRVPEPGSGFLSVLLGATVMPRRRSRRAIL